MAPEVTSIGAGVDSFFEYALKWYIMSGKSSAAFVLGDFNGTTGEIEFLDVWDDAYTAIMRYSRAADGYWVRQDHLFYMSGELNISISVQARQHENRGHSIFHRGLSVRFLAGIASPRRRRPKWYQVTPAMLVVVFSSQSQF
jgi:hypothetical protein